MFFFLSLWSSSVDRIWTEEDYETVEIPDPYNLPYDSCGTLLYMYVKIDV